MYVINKFLLVDFFFQKNWKVENKKYIFKQDVQSKQEISALKIIQNCLGYAKELERIV